MEASCVLIENYSNASSLYRGLTQLGKKESQQDCIELIKWDENFSNQYFSN